MYISILYRYTWYACTYTCTCINVIDTYFTHAKQTERATAYNCVNFNLVCILSLACSFSLPHTHTHTHTRTHTPSLSRALSPSLPPSLSLSRSFSLFFSHTHSLTQKDTHILSLSHTLSRFLTASKSMWYAFNHDDYCFYHSETK